ncbi:MAG TPA: hypothetical protein VL943_07100, partial [Niabella sp.]|nr:hypothetical protein [Niabella sp.]
MKKQFLLTVLLGMSVHGIAQTPPTNANPLNAGQASQDYWSRAGNNSAGNNIFGLKINSPIYTIAGSGFNLSGAGATTYRSKLNATYTGTVNQYPINGFGWGQGVNTTGYMLLGYNTNDLYQNMGAFSLLHLNGQTSGSIQEFGYRPWMKTGVTLTDNADLSYFGLRQMGTGTDITETAIVWSDNAGTTAGPDDMTFRYTQGGAAQGAGTVNLDFFNKEDLDGLHIARFTGEGLMALGNTFGIDVPGPATFYARPQSLLHMSYQFRTGATWEPYGFQQITYRRPFGASSDIIGQGEAATDGLRLGIDNDILSGGPQSYLNSYLRWQ